MFCQYFCLFVAFLPETFWKNYFLVRFSFFGLFSFLKGSRRRRLCFCCVSSWKKLRANRTPHFPPHVFVGLFVFPSSLPTAFVLSPVLAVRPFLFGVFSGCHSGLWAFSNALDSLRTSWGLSSLTPSEAPFSDARRQGVCVDSLLLFLFFPFVVLVAAHVVRKGPLRYLTEAGPGDALGGMTPKEAPRGGRVCPLLVYISFLSNVYVGVAGAPKALLRQSCGQWVFFLGGGGALRSSHARFSPRFSLSVAFFFSLSFSLVSCFLSVFLSWANRLTKSRARTATSSPPSPTRMSCFHIGRSGKLCAFFCFAIGVFVDVFCLPLCSFSF